MPRYSKPKPQTPPPALPAPTQTDNARAAYLEALRSAILPGSGPLSQKCLRQILRARNVAHVLTAEQREQIVALESQWQTAFKAMHEMHGHSAARREFERQLAGVGPDEMARLKDSICHNYHLRRRQNRADMAELSAQAVEICRAGWSAVRRECAAWAEDRERTERADCEAWGVDYAPSLPLLMARRIESESEMLADSLRALSPAKQAAELAQV